MQFAQDAKVATASGEEIGKVARLVIDPRSKAVTHIVVREGVLRTKDRVLPVELVASAEPDRVVLREDTGDLRKLPEYEDEHFVAPGERDWQPEPAHFVMAPAVFYYPPALETPPTGNPRYPGFGANLNLQKNIPEDNVAVSAGTRVVTADGQTLGKVERILTHGDGGQSSHLVVAGGLFREDRVIPVEWIAEVHEAEVRLAVGSATVERARTSQ